MIEWLAKIAFDGTEPDDDIVPRFQCLWWFARVLICKRVDRHAGKFRFNFFSDIVGKSEHRAGVTAFGIIQGLAIRTLAMSIPIILGYRDNARVWRLTQPFLDALNHEVT